MRSLSIAVLAAMAVPALAGEVQPNPSATGELIGPDGRKWVVEGCAAYPAESAANTRDKSAEMSKWIKPAAPRPKSTKARKTF